MENTEIVVHINEELSQEYRESLKQEICKLDGVISADLNEKKTHLMIVGYNPETIKSVQVLDGVKNTGVHAQLVGWL